MSVLKKEFNSPFIVDKSKLRRLIEVAEAKFKEGGNSKFEFEAHLSGQKVVETGSVDEILALDNSKRNRVERLAINCTGTAPGSQEIKQGMLVLGGLLLALTTLNMTPSRLTNEMWLTDQDLKALEPLQSDPTLAREKAGEVLSRQIRNVTLVRQQRHSILPGLLKGGSSSGSPRRSLF